MLWYSPRGHQTVRRIAFAAVMLVATVGSVPAAWAQSQIFVANYRGDSITVYPREATGDVAPSFTIQTDFGDAPLQLAVNHGAGELFVSNNFAYTVSVYDLRTGARKRTIAGPATGLIRPTALVVDEVNGELYVANDYGHSITVYDLLATGNASPKRTITSAAIHSPVGLALDLAHDEIIVSGYGFHSIATFDRLANGFVTAKRVIVGSFTELNLPQGIAFDPETDEIVVANSAFLTPDAGSILAFPRTGDGNIAPSWKLAGSATALCNPDGLTLDLATNELIVANSDFSEGSCAQSVTTYDRGATGNTAPKRIVTGPQTGLVYPTSVVTVGALEYSAQATSVRATILGIQTTLNDTGPIPSSGGTAEVSLLGASIPGVLTVGALQAQASGGGDASSSQASSAGLSLGLTGIGVQAKSIKAIASAVCGSASGSSQISELKINGKAIVVTGQPNQTIKLLLGKVVINEQIAGASGITVNALRVLALGADVVIASAKAGVSCSGMF